MKRIEVDLLGWGHLNAFTGKILWYTLGFFHFSRQPQRGVCRHAGRLIQCPAEFSSQQSLQPPHYSRIVRHLLRESLVDEGRQPQIFRRQLPQPEAEPDERLPQMPVCKRTHSSTPSNSSISSSDAAAQSLGYPAQAVLVCASSSSSSECSRQ